METYVIVFMAGLIIGILLRGEQREAVHSPTFATSNNVGSSLVMYFVLIILIVASVFLLKDVMS